MDFLIHHMLQSSATRFPDKEALVHDDRRLTFAEFARQTRGVAHGLQSAGLKRADRIGVYLEPSVAQALSMLGISGADGVFVPIHHSLFPRQVAHIIRDCGMTGLLTDRAKLDKLADIVQENDSLRFIALTDAPAAANIGLPVHDFEDWCRSVPTENSCQSAIGKDLAAILYTSGSTGRPKGVMLSHANVMAGASIVSTYLNITPEDRTLAILPFSFDAGLNQLMTALEQGATLVLQNFLFAREIVRKLKQEQVTGLAGVPPLWSLLVQPSSGLHETDLPQLRYITNTGGALPQTVLSGLRKALPTTQVFLMYGLTEAFRSTYLPPQQLDRRGTSIGKAIPNTEIFVVNERGDLCQPGEIGELVHHGPTVSLGYWGQPELTGTVLRPHPFPPPGLTEVPKVCYSGDLVRKDEEGFLYFVARRDNQIKSSGFRISPTEVEEVLCQSGSLQEAAVIGVPDETLGQQIKAFVKPREGADLDPDELLAFCAGQMPRHMVPKSVEIVDSLPKTASGKIDYPALRRRAGLSV